MATAPILPGNVVNVVRGTIADGAGNTTAFHALDPNFLTSILVDKNGVSTTVSVTNAQRLKAGGVITDLEAAEIPYVDVDSGTADYLAGENRGLTGVKINANPSGADVEYSILQYKGK